MIVDAPQAGYFQQIKSQELPYASQELVWQNETDMQRAFDKIQMLFDASLEQFILFSYDKEFSHAYTVWSDLVFDYFSFLLTSYDAMRLSPDPKLQAILPQKRDRLQAQLQQTLLNHPRLEETWIANAQHSHTLTPQQRAITESILQEYQQLSSSPDLEQALATLKPTEKASFAYTQGLANPLDPTSLRALSIFTANIICFPGYLPYTYGGIAPWKERLDALVEIIVKTDAPLVALQEVWDPRAMRQLIEKLKPYYAHFVYNAGAPAGTIHLNKMGYSSGLLLASKLPPDHIHFETFPRSIPEGSNRGTLLITSRVVNQSFSLITTHLQHGNDPEQIALRKEQLALCSQRLLVQPTKAQYLVGDLNINALTPELSTSNLSQLFQLSSTLLENNPSTCTEYFNTLVLTPLEQRFFVPKTPEYLDYCVCPTQLPKQQQIIPLFSLEKPTEALSDHHGVLTTWDILEAPGNS